MADIGGCALCEKLKELKESHIIPKFIGKWLKDTSATGYLRLATEPNLRRQDLIKMPLLCHECEEKFSVYEKRFAEKIFIPFQKGNKEFHYEEWLVSFIISISWRIIVSSEFDYLKPQFKNEVLKAMEVWRRFLNGENNNRGKYKHHIFFLDYIQSVSPDLEIHKHMNSYLLRAVDSTLIDSELDVFVYTKLPGIMLISHIYPFNIKGWQGTQIENNGNVKIPQICRVPGLAQFINDRIKDTNTLIDQMDMEEREKINKTAIKNIDKLKNSKSTEVLLADMEFVEKHKG